MHRGHEKMILVLEAHAANVCDAEQVELVVPGTGAELGGYDSGAPVGI